MDLTDCFNNVNTIIKLQTQPFERSQVSEGIYIHINTYAVLYLCIL